MDETQWEKLKPLVDAIGDNLVEIEAEACRLGFSVPKWMDEKKPGPFDAGFFVYRITNCMNGFHYIGCTTRLLPQRWQQHLTARYSKKDSWKPLYRDMLKYGIEQFTMNLVAECASKFEMRQQETRFILQYDSIWPHGYNLDTGRMRDAL